MPSNVTKIPIRRQHREVMTHAELCQQGIDRADLYPGTPAAVTQRRSIDMILPIRYQKRQGREAPENL